MMGKHKKTGNHNVPTTHFAFLPMIEDKMQQAAWKKISAFSWVDCLCAAAAAESGLIYKSHWCYLSGIAFELFFFPRYCRWQLAGVSKWQICGKTGKECLRKQQMNYRISHELGAEKYFHIISMVET